MELPLLYQCAGTAVDPSCQLERARTLHIVKKLGQFMKTQLIFLVDYAVHHVVSHTETSVMVLMN